MNGTEQEEVNSAVWSGDELVAEYATRRLRPVESVMIARYQQQLSGRVLELGCGAGRLLGYVAEAAGEMYGLDISPAMVAYCRRAYPNATVDVGDLRDLSRFEEGFFSVVIAGANLLDVLSDDQRRASLSEIQRIVAADGLLIFSSHNRDYSAPLRRRLRALLGGRHNLLPRIFKRRTRAFNRSRLQGHERAEADYAIVNDEAHDYSLLHYYITMDAQRRQLAELGYELIEVLDLDGQRLERREQSVRCPELHYVARPAS